MSHGSLLQRNKSQSIDVVVIESIEGGTCDPLSSDFVIPQWLRDSPTPWDLITYFQKCLNELVTEGKERTLAGGFSREIKPARKLLTHGLEVAARACRLTANETYGSVSLHRALDRVDEIRRSTD